MLPPHQESRRLVEVDIAELEVGFGEAGFRVEKNKDQGAVTTFLD